MQQLLAKQSEAIAELSREYERLEAIAAERSHNFYNHKDEYLASLEAAQAPLRTLAKLSTNFQWPRLINYFNRMKKVISQAQSPLTEQDSITELGTLVQAREATQDKHIYKPKQRQITIPNVAKQAEQVNKGFRSLLEIYNTFVNTVELKEKISLLSSLHYQLFYLVDAKNEKLKLEEIKQLKKIEQRVNQEAKKYLQHALLKGDFATAESLHEFFSLIGYELLNLALMAEDLNLLAFLVATMNFPIDTYPIRIRGEQYKNAMQYCYLKANESNKLSQVMELLVTHGISLMQSIEPGGLPIAHHILSARPSHPLIIVLQNTPEYTLHSKCFYQQLLRVCQRQLAKPNLSRLHNLQIKKIAA